ncbi:carboxypeptidase-like regulatory domain-containing protein [bacterium]|nr:carboxypeptidase-like regulatory domain-containing protein [bacterium]
MRLSLSLVLTATLTLGGLFGCFGLPDESLIPPAVISGIVLDSASGDAVIGATILVEELELSALSDVEGRFRITVPYGSYFLKATHLDYYDKTLSVEVTADHALADVEFRLTQNESIRRDNELITPVSTD